MLTGFGRAGLLFVVVGISGCARVPELPSEQSLPIQEILRHGLCELRTAFLYLRDHSASFKAEEWAIGITITPKVDIKATGRLGAAGRTSTLATRFFSWTLGTAPGAGYESKGQTNAKVSFNVPSAALLNDPRFLALKCEDILRPSNHMPLTKDLGVGDWLVRVVKIADAEGVELRDPTFSAQIVVTYDGGTGLTYTVPRGTRFGSISGSRSVDQTVGFAFTRDKRQPKVVTLPQGQQFGAGAAGQGTVSPSAASRLDFLRLEETLRTLQQD